MPLEFKKAEKKRSKLRIALIAPAGHGKTYSSLLIAKGLGGKTAMIDTESGRGELYGGKFDYDIVSMTAPYMVEKYLAAIKLAEDSGYNNIIIDSLSHAWSGTGGLLDQQGKIADSGKGNSFSAWRTITPLHNALIDAIISSKCHVIVTMRAKSEYLIDKDENGRSTVKKVGLAPVQRDGIEYEMTTVFDIEKNHTASTSKDSTGLFDGKLVKLDETVGQELLTWLNEESNYEDKKKQALRPMVGNAAKSNVQ